MSDAVHPDDSSRDPAWTRSSKAAIHTTLSSAPSPDGRYRGFPCQHAVFPARNAPMARQLVHCLPRRSRAQCRMDGRFRLIASRRDHARKSSGCTASLMAQSFNSSSSGRNSRDLVVEKFDLTGRGHDDDVAGIPSTI